MLSKFFLIIFLCFACSFFDKLNIFTNYSNTLINFNLQVVVVSLLVRAVKKLLVTFVSL